MHVNANMYMREYTYVCSAYVQVTIKDKEGIRCPGTGGRSTCQLPYESWDQDKIKSPDIRTETIITEVLFYQVFTAIHICMITGPQLGSRADVKEVLSWVLE